MKMLTHYKNLPFENSLIPKCRIFKSSYKKGDAAVILFLFIIFLNNFLNVIDHITDTSLNSFDHLPCCAS